jgi:hypothetical protein
MAASVMTDADMVALGPDVVGRRPEIHDGVLARR